MSRAAPVRLSVRGSPALAVAFAALHLATIAVAWRLPWPSWVMGAVTGAVLLHGAWAIWVKSLRRLPKAIASLELDAEGALRLVLRDGSEQAAQVLAGSVVLASLVVLAYRVSGQRCSQRLLLTPDAVGKDALRKLRISLRHRRLADPRRPDSSATAGPQ